MRWRDEVINLAILAVIVGSAVVAWPTAPDLVPVLWTPVSGSGSLAGRFEGVAGIPLLAVIVYAMFLWLPRIDPLRDNYERFRGAYAVLRTAMLAALLGTSLFGHLALWSRPADTDVTLAVIGGSLMLVAGNFLPKVKQNWFIGVRTPWTLTSEEAWRRTHRLAGWMLVTGGGIALWLVFTAPASSSRAALFATLVSTIVASTVYSYFVWRADRARGRREA